MKRPNREAKTCARVALPIQQFLQMRPALCVCLLLALFAANATYTSSRPSATFDETPHIAAGYSYY